MLSAIIVDDEKRSLDRFKRIMKDVDQVTLKEAFQIPERAFEYIANNNIDVVFLDIEMPTISGLELAEMMMQENYKINIVFVSAHSQYAMEAFNVHAIDYLVKPTNSNMIQKVINNIIKKIDAYSTSYISDKLYVEMFGDACFCMNYIKKEKIIFRTKKTEELLFFLVNAHGNYCSRDSILDALWSYMNREKAVTNFHSTMYELRKTLKEFGCIDFLIKTKDQYKINTDKLWCDAYVFIELSQELRKSNESISDIEKVIKLADGSYLFDKDYNWALSKQRWFDNELMKILYKAEQLYSKERNDKSRIETLETLVKLYPLEDLAYIHLIKHYVNKNELMTAIKWYKIYQSIMKRELGIEPAQEIKQLIEKIT